MFQERKCRKSESLKRRTCFVVRGRLKQSRNPCQKEATPNQFPGSGDVSLWKAEMLSLRSLHLRYQAVARAALLTSIRDSEPLLYRMSLLYPLFYSRLFADLCHVVRCYIMKSLKQIKEHLLWCLQTISTFGGYAQFFC